MHAAVIVFPGSNCDRDLAVALEKAGAKVSMVWHKDTEMPSGVDFIGVPGGFSFGDYLRCGAIAANSPICRSVIAHANRGGYVFGVCNGFQILVELGLLQDPGLSPAERTIALTDNESSRFECRWVTLREEDCATSWLSAGTLLPVPVAHAEGRFVVRDEETLARLVERRQVALTYVDPADPERADVPYPLNPNGSIAASVAAGGGAPAVKTCTM